MASSSTANQSPMPQREAATNYLPYPPPLAKYEDVVISPRLFMDTLEKLHSTMGTKFMIPIIGGKDLDLHRLFVEVTSRGGIEKIIRERRWKEVTAVFSFPSTATNASFVLRKYYVSLLYHYEQIYFCQAKSWVPSVDPFQSLSSPPVPPKGLAEPVLASPEIQAAAVQPLRINVADHSPGASSTPSTGTPLNGVIDGKFDGGYLITVTTGSEQLKGVIYLAQQDPASQVPHHSMSQHQRVSASNNDNAPAASGMQRRRRRKKSEMKKRDPAHPKPNRSGYNFFFAEQHARLKPLHPGKDRAISRMIGELWTKMVESEKAVYQDKAMKDKERYRIEMEDYRRSKTGQIVSNAVPIQQRPPALDINLMETNDKIDTEGEESPQSLENESGSEDKTADKDSDVETSPVVEVGAENMGMENLVDEVGFELHNRVETVGDESLESSYDIVMEATKKESVAVEEKGSMPCDGKELLPSEERDSVSAHSGDN